MITVKNMFYLMTVPVITALACWMIWVIVL